MNGQCDFCFYDFYVVNVLDFVNASQGGNDSLAIQDAIDDVAQRLENEPEYQGGTVIFPGIGGPISNPQTMVYNLDVGDVRPTVCVQLKSRIKLMGVGRPILRFTDGHGDPNAGADSHGLEIRMMATSNTAGDSQHPGFTVFGDWPWRKIVIENLVFDHNRRGNPPGRFGMNWDQSHVLFLAGVHDCCVRNCDFNNVMGDGIGVHTGALDPLPSERVSVFDCRFYDFLRSGIHYKHVKDSDAHHNLFSDSLHGTAINMEMDSSEVRSENASFFSNDIYACGIGVKLAGGLRDDPAATLLKVYNNRFDLQPPGAPIRGSANAIRVSECNDVVIQANEIRNARVQAISVRSCHRINISLNRIIDTLEGVRRNPLLPYDVWLPTGERHGIIGVDSTYSTEEPGVTVVGPPTDDLVIENNIIADNVGQGMVLRHVKILQVQGNRILRNASVGINLQKSVFGGLIACNVIAHNEEAGISVADASTDNYFRRNVIAFNRANGVHIRFNAGFYSDFGSVYDGGNNCITGNIPYGLQVDLDPTAQGIPLPVQLTALWNWWGCDGLPIVEGIQPSVPSSESDPNCDGIRITALGVGVRIYPYLFDGCEDVYYDFLLGSCALPPTGPRPLESAAR